MEETPDLPVPLEVPRLPALHPANPATPLRAAVLGTLAAGAVASVPALLYSTVKLWSVAVPATLVLFVTIAFTGLLRDAELRTLTSGRKLPLALAGGLIGAILGALLLHVLSQIWLVQTMLWSLSPGAKVFALLGREVGFLLGGGVLGGTLGLAFGAGVARDRLGGRRPEVALLTGTVFAVLACLFLLPLAWWTLLTQAPDMFRGWGVAGGWGMSTGMLFWTLASQIFPILVIDILAVLTCGSLPFLLGTVDPRRHLPEALPDQAGEPG